MFITEEGDGKWNPRRPAYTTLLHPNCGCPDRDKILVEALGAHTFRVEG